MRCSSTRRAAQLFVILGLVTANGCGDGRIERYPVEGTVLVDGQPADGALVFFCPVNASGELENLRPSGKADASGKFTLTTIDFGDGAPAGEYKVLAQWPSPTPVVDDGRDGRGTRPGPDRLKKKYYNLDTTPLTAIIEEKSNELSPFELTSK
jgi:hypothetical protein